MVEISDIKDKDSLRAWLENQPREVSVWIASRAAARVLPIWWKYVLTEDWARQLDLKALPILRSVLTSSVAVVVPNEDIKGPAAAAGRAFDTKYDRAGTFFHAAFAAAAVDRAGAAGGATDAAKQAAMSADIPIITGGRVVKIDPEGITGSDIWNSIRTDAEKAADGKFPNALPLWSDGPGPLAKEWAQIKAELGKSPDLPDWQFWLDWYDAQLAGRTMLPDPKRTWGMLERIATEIDPATWDAGPEVVNPIIREIWEEHTGTVLSDAAIVDFDFNAALQQMDVVGFDDDLAHLKDPEAVAAFVDDIEELQDGLQDFLDFSEQERRNSNALPMLGRAAEKVLDELRRTQDKTHIRARRLVVLGGYLYSFSLEEDKRDELGDTLTNMLDRNVGLLQLTCKKHLAPSLARLEPLTTLERGENEPEDMLATMRQALDTLRAADGQDMARLSPEGRAVLGEMVSELEELVTAADAASTPERRDTLLARFTRGYGGVSATFGRYIEKARPHAKTASEGVDQLIKNFRRWKSIEDILKFLEGLL